MVNTCCLIPNNSKWPLSSLLYFKCLTYVRFWVFWVPLQYPKIIISKTMTSRLSNAVSHMSLWSLVAYLHPFKIWRLFHNFERKSDIFTNWMEYQKNMNIEWDETFDLGWLYKDWHGARKLRIDIFRKNCFWVPLGTTFACSVTFVRSIDMFSIQKFTRMRTTLG